MKRLLPLALLFAACSARGAKPIQFVVGPGKDLTITFPGYTKPDLRDVLVVFFSKEDPAMKTQFMEAFKSSGDITLILTTK